MIPSTHALSIPPDGSNDNSGHSSYRSARPPLGAASPDKASRKLQGSFRGQLRIPVSPAMTCASSHAGDDSALGLSLPRSNMMRGLSRPPDGNLSSFRLSRHPSARAGSTTPAGGLLRVASFRDAVDQSVMEKTGKAPKGSTPNTPALSLSKPMTPTSQTTPRTTSILGQLSEMEQLREENALMEEQLGQAMEMGEVLVQQMAEKDAALEEMEAELVELERELDHMKRRTNVATNAEYGDRLSAALAQGQVFDLESELEARTERLEKQMAEERENLNWVHETELERRDIEKAALEKDKEALGGQTQELSLHVLAGEEAAGRSTLLEDFFFDTCRAHTHFVQRIQMWLDADALTFRNEKAAMEVCIAQLEETVTRGEARAAGLESELALANEAVREGGLREAKLEAEVTRVQGDLDRARARSEELTKELQKLGDEQEGELNEFIKTSERLNQVEEALAAAQGEAEELRRTSAAAQAHNESLSSQLATAKAEADDLCARGDALSKERQQLQQALSRLEAEHADHVSRAVRDRELLASQHHTEVAHRDETITTLRAQTQRQERALAQAAGEAKGLVHDVADAQRRLAACEGDNAALKRDLEKSTDAVDKLTRAGNEHEIALRASHAFAKAIHLELETAVAHLAACEVDEDSAPPPAEATVPLKAGGALHAGAPMESRTASFGAVVSSAYSSPMGSPHARVEAVRTLPQELKAKTVWDVSPLSTPRLSKPAQEEQARVREAAQALAGALREGVENAAGSLEDLRRHVVWYKREAEKAQQKEARRDQVILELEVQVQTLTSSAAEAARAEKAAVEKHGLVVRELSDKSEELHELAERLADTEQTLRTKEAAVQKLHTEIAALNFATQEQRSAVTAMEGEVERERSSAAQLATQNTALEAASAEAKRAAGAAQDAARRVRVEADDLTDSLEREAAAHKETKRTRDRLERLAHERLLEVEKAISEAAIAHRAQERTQGELADANARYNDLHRDALARETDLQTRTGELSRSEGTVAHLRGLLETLQADVAETQEREEDTKRVVEELRVKLDAATATQLQTERRRARLELEVSDAREQQASMRDELDASALEAVRKYDALAASARDVERELRDAKALVDDRHAAVAEITARAEDQRAEADLTHASLQQTVTHLELRAENLEKELRRVRALRESELAHNREEKVHLLSRVEGLETEVLELESRGETVKSALEREGKRCADAAAEAVKDLTLSVERKEINERALAEQLQRTQALLEERDARCFNYESSLNATVAELEDLKGNLGKLEASLRLQLEAAQGDVARLTAQNQRMADELDGLRALEHAGRADPVVSRLLAKIEALKKLEHSESAYADKLAAYQHSVAELLVLNETPPSEVLAKAHHHRAGSRTPLALTASPRGGSATLAPAAPDKLNLKFESLQARLLRLDDELRTSQQCHQSAEADMARTSQLLKYSAAAQSPARPALHSPHRQRLSPSHQW